MKFPKNIPFLLLLLVLSSMAFEEISSTQSNTSALRDDLPPIDPEKEEWTSPCPTLLERIADFFLGEFELALRTCLEEERGNDDDDDGHSNEFDSRNDTVDQSEPVGEKISQLDGPYITFDLYVALWPEAQSIGWIIGPAITEYLDMSLTSCNVVMNRKDLARVQRRNDTDVDMILMSNRLDPTIHLKEHDRDWWHYTFKYKCYWAGTHMPINETRWEELDREVKASLRKVEALKNEVLADIEKLLNASIAGIFDANLYPPNVTDGSADPDTKNPSSLPSRCPQQCCDTNPDLACKGEQCTGASPRCKDLQPCNQPCSDTETHSPSDSPNVPALSPTSMDPLETSIDIETWDFRRYVGLGLLLMTVSGTFLLIQLAEIRRRYRLERSNWGNLATEEGVDELLRMGWKLDGSKMEVYDKRKLGYQDNDSMLAGGFQQTVIVGAEITVSQSETTPETP